MSKAQLSLEFMVIIAILLFLTILIISAAGERLADFSRDKDVFLLNDVAAMVKNEVQIASAMKPGYVRTFEVPLTLEGKEYAIAVQNDSITAQVNNFEIVLFIQPVNGTLVQGANVIRKAEGNVTLN